MKAIKWLMVAGLAFVSIGGFAQSDVVDDAYMTPSKARQLRAERIKQAQDKEAKRAEAIAKLKEENEKFKNDVTDWYNRRDMKVTVEEMEDNLDRLDGTERSSKGRGGKYANRLRRFHDDDNKIVLTGVNRVYIIDDMDYDPWSGSYYGYDYGSNASVIINTRGGYYGSPWRYSPYYYGYASSWYPWYSSWYDPFWGPSWRVRFYDPWYDPFWSPGFYVGFGWGHRPFYAGYYGGYYGGYYHGFYDGYYSAPRNNYSAYGRSTAAGYYGRGTATNANSHRYSEAYSRALGRDAYGQPRTSTYGNSNNNTRRYYDASRSNTYNNSQNRTYRSNTTTQPTRSYNSGSSGTTYRSSGSSYSNGGGSYRSNNVGGGGSGSRRR